MEKQNASEQNSSDQNKQNTLTNEYLDNVMSYIKGEMPDMDPSISSAGGSSMGKDCSKGTSQANNGQILVGCLDLTQNLGFCIQYTKLMSIINQRKLTFFVFDFLDHFR